MKASKVYLEAARTLGEPFQIGGYSEFSCSRIGQITGDYTRCPLRQAYNRTFHPDPIGDPLGQLTPAHVVKAAAEEGVSPKDLRILMLCLMAAIVEA